MLYLIDRNPRSIGLHNRIANSKLGEIFGDPREIYAIFNKDNNIVIGGLENGTKITINRGMNLIRQYSIMHAEIKACDEYKKIVDAQSKQITQQSEQIIELQEQVDDLTGRLSEALHKAKIFEDSFMAAEAANAELTKAHE